MDLFLQPRGKPSSRRKNELHGPRPSPLKLQKDSHKIIKPPIIIYTVSPKVIHTNPNEFMSLVQRLTGFSSDTKASYSSSSSADSDDHIIAMKPENDAELIELSSPNLFSPSVMEFMNSSFFHHELSSVPVYHENKGFVESAVLASPGSFFCSL